MTSRRSTLIIVAIIAAVVIGIVIALNTRAAFAHDAPAPEPTPVVVYAVTGEEPTAEPTAVPVAAVTAIDVMAEPGTLRLLFIPWVEGR
jgi:hypothetical protein